MPERVRFAELRLCGSLFRSRYTLTMIEGWLDNYIRSKRETPEQTRVLFSEKSRLSAQASGPGS